MSEDELVRLIVYLSKQPESGDLIPRTGGIRKLRWRTQDSGKRGGVRVIYYYYNRSIPLFALSVYKKGKKENLSKSEEKILAGLTKELVKHYKR